MSSFRAEKLRVLLPCPPDSDSVVPCKTILSEITPVIARLHTHHHCNRPPTCGPTNLNKKLAALVFPETSLLGPEDLPAIKKRLSEEIESANLLLQDIEKAERALEQSRADPSKP